MADSKSDRAENEPRAFPPFQATKKPGARAEKSLGTLPTSAGDTSLDPEALFNPQNAGTKPQIPVEFGRYRVLRALGAGAMGAVYLAEDTLLHRQVALKIPQLGNQQDSSRLERFFREARLAATLSHPNICPIHDIGEHGGTHFISMAFITGRTLAELLKSGKPISERSAASVVRKLAVALHEAHQKGVIHRDLKPANIMIDQRGEPIVMDFGLARFTTATDQAQITQSGAILGTPAYMSPEQVQGASSAIGASADIYALGVILYQMLCGRLPFEGSVVAVLAQIATQAPVPPSSHRAGVSPELEAICLRAMARDPADRYGSMGDFAAALSDFLKRSRGSTAPVPPGKDEPAPGPAAQLPAFAPSEWEIVAAPPSQTALRQASLSSQWLTFLVVHRIWFGMGACVLVAGLVGVWIGGGLNRDNPKNRSAGRKSTAAIEPAADDVSMQGDSAEEDEVDDQPAFSSEVAGLSEPRFPSAELHGVNDQPRPETAQPGVSLEPVADLTDNNHSSDAGFVSLFNGKDLTGWRAAPGHAIGFNNWRVKNGILVGSGGTMSHLFSSRGDYRDFHLHIVARVNAGGNGGVYFRSPLGLIFPEVGSRFPGGYEAQIADDFSRDPNKTGSLFAQTGKRFVPLATVQKSPVRMGERFTMDIFARGNHITIEIDGKEVIDYIDRTAVPGAAGHIVLQQHDGASEIEFLKIIVKKYEPEPIKPNDDPAPKSVPGGAKGPAAAKGGPEFGLNAELFADTALSGVPVTRIDTALNFNWDRASPHASIPGDYFSARWRGWLKVPVEGTYQFRVMSNDGVRAWIGDQTKPLINLWESRPVTMITSCELTAEPKELKVEMYEAQSTAWLVLFWKPPGTTRFSPIPPEFLFRTEQGAGARLLATVHPTQGLRADVYAGADSKTLAATYFGAGLEAKWDDEVPLPIAKPDDFSVILRGYLSPPNTGTYKFRGAGDDRVTFKIDGKMIVQHQEGSQPGEGTINLDAKKQYEVELRTLDRRGGATFYIHWVLPETDAEVSIPTEYLWSQPQRKTKTPSKAKR